MLAIGLQLCHSEHDSCVMSCAMCVADLAVASTSVLQAPRCVTLEWAGSGELIAPTKYESKQLATLLGNPLRCWEEYEAWAQLLQKHIFACLESAEVSLPKLGKWYNFGSANTSKHAPMQSSLFWQVRVFAGHNGLELTTLTPNVAHKSAQHLQQINAWKSNTLSAAPTAPSAPTAPTPSTADLACLVLSVTFYDRNVCAAALVSKHPARYANLLFDLQQNKQVIMAMLHANPYRLVEVVEVCDSTVFRSDKDILLASNSYFALQYASNELRNDVEFVEAMMRNNVRAVEFADPTLLTAAFVAKHLSNMHEDTFKLILRKNNCLHQDAVLMQAALLRWPHLLGVRHHCGLVQLLAPSQFEIFFKAEHNDSNQRIDNDCIAAVAGAIEIRLPIHLHEVVLCTSSQKCSRCMQRCGLQYRCACWCNSFYCCVACAKQCGSGSV